MKIKYFAKRQIIKYLNLLLWCHAKTKATLFDELCRISLHYRQTHDNHNALLFTIIHRTQMMFEEHSLVTPKKYQFDKMEWKSYASWNHHMIWSLNLLKYRQVSEAYKTAEKDSYFYLAIYLKLSHFSFDMKLLSLSEKISLQTCEIKSHIWSILGIEFHFPIQIQPTYILRLC